MGITYIGIFLEWCYIINCGRVIYSVKTVFQNQFAVYMYKLWHKHPLRTSDGQTDSILCICVSECVWVFLFLNDSNKPTNMGQKINNNKNFPLTFLNWQAKHLMIITLLKWRNCVNFLIHFFHFFHLLDEEGQDAGGLLREWYIIISREIFNPMYALFCVSPGDRVTYMINPSSHANPNHLSYFKFVGRLIGNVYRVSYFHVFHFRLKNKKTFVLLHSESNTW